MVKVQHPSVTVDRQEAVAIVTLQRPQARNAINAEVALRLEEVFFEIDTDPDIRVSVLTGSGDTFCAGADLKALAKGESPTTPRGGFGGITECPPMKPIVAAAEGFAIAGGLELLLSCDIIVAGDSTFFGLPEVKHGLVAAGGGLIHLPRRIPYHVALELALTGDFITADRAFHLGLVNHVTPDGEALRTALELAHRISGNGPLAIEVTKKVVTEQWRLSGNTAWDRQKELARAVFESDDAHEGAQAFSEKRPPVWTGA